MSIKTLEERIVNLKKFTAGVETTEQAELRQLDMRGEGSISNNGGSC